MISSLKHIIKQQQPNLKKNANFNNSDMSCHILRDKEINPYLFSSRKEVIQPQVLLRLPCYDFTPVAEPTVEGSQFGIPASGELNSHGVTGGVYKTRERIHRDILIRDY